jgi:hypothetical protein
MLKIILKYLEQQTGGKIANRGAVWK